MISSRSSPPSDFEIKSAFEGAAEEQITAGRRMFMINGVSTWLRPLSGLDTLTADDPNYLAFLKRNQIREDARAHLRDYICDNPGITPLDKVRAGMYLLSETCRTIVTSDDSFRHELEAIDMFAGFTHHPEFDEELALEVWHKVGLDD